MDVEKRIVAGNRVNGTLAALIRRRNVSTAACLVVRHAVLVPKFLWQKKPKFLWRKFYGSETWVLQKKNERKMNVVDMRSLRRICGVSLSDRIRNEEIHRITGTSDDVTVRI